MKTLGQASGGLLHRTFERVGVPLRWRDPAKCFIVAATTVPFPVINLFMIDEVIANPAVAPFLNLDFLPLFRDSQIFLAIAWSVLLIFSLLFWKWGKERSTFLVYLTTQLFALGNAFLIYCFGTFTNPGAISFLGSAIVAALLFGWGRALWALGTAGFFIIGTLFAEAHGFASYAPIMSGAPFEGGQLSRWWLNSMGVASAGFLVNVLLLNWFMMTMWYRREDELATVNKQLSDALRIKDDFVSMVSHELRTPLTAIGGSLRLIAASTKDAASAETGQLLAIAYRNTDRLMRIVNDLLDAKKIEARGLELSLRPLDAGDMVDALISDMEALADEKGLHLEKTVTAEGIQILADHDRLLQVLWNLVYNAMKFSPPEGTVEVRVTLDNPHEVKFSVLDEGPGVPEEKISSLFQAFYQVDSTSTRKTPGTGLGLTIVKAIVEGHGGRVGMHNRPGGGACFYFTIPLTSTQSAPAGGLGATS